MITSYPLLNWVLLAVSLFNTIVLLWLGLTLFKDTTGLDHRDSCYISTSCKRL